MNQKIALQPREYWWGGAVSAGTQMPYRAEAALDLRGENFANQAAPFLVSSTGRYLWSDEPFAFRFEGRSLTLEGKGPFVIEAKATMKEAFREASARFFPPRQKIPPALFFNRPQYNTWIELMYDQNQKDVLKYAKDLLRAGYPPGVLMIDEGWQRYYGHWDFDPILFPDPKKMMQQLHRMGFKVMLWVVPFVVPDSRVYRALRDGNVLVKEPGGKVAVREWWNGHSAVVDLTGGEGRAWFLEQMDALRRKYGVDGFKFDAGDTPGYRDGDKTARPVTPNGHTEAFGQMGTRYRFNEYRACWKCAGEPLVQRLGDRAHSWDERGLASVLPNMIAQGLLGHAFGCPDMIGGGEYTSFLSSSSKLDPELFVRYAQACALMPMMQFSAGTWRVLDRKHHKLCIEAARLHMKFGAKILRLAKEASQTGEPIVRHLAYEFPGHGYEPVSNQFLLGGEILVAPVLQKGATTRKVLIPPGDWKADDGTVYSGPAEVEVQAPLERLPYFTKKS